MRMHETILAGTLAGALLFSASDQAPVAQDEDRNVSVSSEFTPAENMPTLTGEPTVAMPHMQLYPEVPRCDIAIALTFELQQELLNTGRLPDLPQAFTDADPLAAVKVSNALDPSANNDAQYGYAIADGFANYYDPQQKHEAPTVWLATTEFVSGSDLNVQLYSQTCYDEVMFALNGISHV